MSAEDEGIIARLAAETAEREARGNYGGAPEPEPYIDDRPPADPRCWACTRRKGETEDGFAPLCRRHYIELSYRVPARLLDGEPPAEGSP